MLSRLILTSSLLVFLAATAVAEDEGCGPEYGINPDTGLWDCYYWLADEYIGAKDGEFTFKLSGPAQSGLPAFSADCSGPPGTSSFTECSTTSGDVKAYAYLTPEGALAEGLGTLHVKVDFGSEIYSVTDPNVSFNKDQSPAYGKGLWPDTKG